MRKLTGLRPQDLLVLLKIISLNNDRWRMTDLANELFMSQSEISEALFRDRYAGLVNDSKRLVHRESLLELLTHGVKYVFPQKPGAVVRGIPTAHSAPPLSELIHSEESVYVWRDDEGTVRGEEIEPLYPTVPKAAQIDKTFYELVALVDAIRVGKTREYELAVDQLKRRILQK
jgi:DNA-binding MarR family transcriptional regulator